MDQDDYFQADDQIQIDDFEQQAVEPRQYEEAIEYSENEIAQLHKEVKAIVKPADKPTLFKEAVPQDKDRKSAATNLFMKSLILAQESKVELT